jgi:hypothetical protein
MKKEAKGTNHRSQPKHIGGVKSAGVVGNHVQLDEKLRGHQIWERLKVDYEKIFGVKWSTDS